MSIFTNIFGIVMASSLIIIVVGRVDMWITIVTADFFYVYKKKILWISR